MRRPAIRLMLTLACATLVIGAAPATSEAGIIPWAWDTLFGPVGSIQARKANRCGYGCNDVYSGGCCQGPAPRMYSGWRGYSSGCGCSSGCSSCGATPYASGGFVTGGTGCNSCGSSYGSYDGGYGGYYGGGYISMPFGGGGCANGQCNANYPPGGSCTVDPNATIKPEPDPKGGPAAINGGATGDSDGFVPPKTPTDSTTNDGFKPAGTNKSPAPTGGDPTDKDNFQPPKVTPEAVPAPEGAAPAAGSTSTPAVEPKPEANPKKSKLTEEDDKASVGPRLELEEKVTWNAQFTRTRLTRTALRVSSTANRHGHFAKNHWQSNETELAKK